MIIIIEKYNTLVKRCRQAPDQLSYHALTLLYNTKDCSFLKPMH